MDYYTSFMKNSSCHSLLLLYRTYSHDSHKKVITFIQAFTCAFRANFDVLVSISGFREFLQLQQILSW